MRVLVVAAVSLLALGAAACSEGEPIEAPEPTSEPTAAPVAEVAPPEALEIEPTALPDPVVVPTEPPIAATTATPSEPELPALPDPVVPETVLPYQRPPTPLAEFANFPDDVAIVYRDGFRCYEGCGWSLPLHRIYKRDGELVRDALFTEDHPMIQGLESYGHYAAATSDQVRVIATADGSRMVAALCHRASCSQSGYALMPDVLPLPTTDLYESLDGGVTWQHIDTLERAWSPEAITAGSDAGEPLLLLSSLVFSESLWWAYMLWSGGGVEIEEADFLRLKRMAAEGVRESAYDRFPGELPVWEPGDIVGGEAEKVLLYAVQFGPFLRVADDVGDCLPVLADPSPDAAELACAAARVLLQDQGDRVTDEGTAWHSVKTPAGITGWADGRSLD